MSSKKFKVCFFGSKKIRKKFDFRSKNHTY